MGELLTLLDVMRYSPSSFVRLGRIRILPDGLEYISYVHSGGGGGGDL